ncbi:MAG UNVERIFIED_CONTAM: DUF1549 domain-containing protein [Planctomycetaceae bacterium]
MEPVHPRTAGRRSTGPAARRAPKLAALGLLTLGRMFDRNKHDVIDDQIDVVGRGFLGLTLACARCHDREIRSHTHRRLLLALRRFRQLLRTAGTYLASDR